MIKNYLIKRLGRFPKLFWIYFAPRLLADPWQRRIFPQQHWLLKRVKGLNPKSILEVGCGFGRNLKWLSENGIDPSRLTGADFNNRLLSWARISLSEPVHLVKADVCRLPFGDNRFELVFTHGLLMHVNPRNLNTAISELIRVTKKYLIIIEEVRRRSRQLNHFTWAHDYDKIIKSLELKVIVKKQGKYSLVWYLLKKLNTAIGASLTRTNCYEPTLIICRPAWLNQRPRFWNWGRRPGL